MIAASGICSISPAPNTGVGMRKITLLRASSASNDGCAIWQRSAPFMPAMVNRSCTPPSDSNRASRTGPFAVMKEGNLFFIVLRLFKNETCGFLAGLDPPDAGFA